MFALSPELPHHAHGRHELVTEDEVDARCDGHRRVARLETLTGQMQCNQAPGTGSVDSHAGTFQVKEIGDAVCRHGAGLSGVRALVHGHAFGVAEKEVSVVCTEGSDEAGCFAAHELGECDARWRCQHAGQEVFARNLPFSSPSYVTSSNNLC